MTTATIAFAQEEPITPRQKDRLLEIIAQMPEPDKREAMLIELEGGMCKEDAAEMISFLIGDDR